MPGVADRFAVCVYQTSSRLKGAGGRYLKLSAAAMGFDESNQGGRSGLPPCYRYAARG